jgi:calcineurin-like phosphoesterase family protein
MTIWFTADNHFGHKRIIELANRPFDSIEQMDEVMIERWNNCIAKGDLVYHLGDFSFADQDLYLSRLNGQKRFVKGNHDHSNRMSKTGWQTINEMLDIRVNDTSIVLCHYALRVWSKSGHGSLHFYGHSHNNLPGDSQCCDVGVDAWNFYPVTLEDIKGRLATLPERGGEPDHHGKPYKEKT